MSTKQQTPPPEEKPRQDFADLIAELADGDLNQQAGDKLTEIVEAVEKTGKAGKLVLTIDVKKSNRMAVVAASIKITKPQDALDPSMFHIDEHGRLCREDPRQLNLKNVSATPPTPIKIIDGGKTE